jgi:hypothetical protein
VQVNKKLEEVLTNKNSIIRALQYDVTKVSKAHNDLIRVYEAKLAEYGIPAGRCKQSLSVAQLQLQLLLLLKGHCSVVAYKLRYPPIATRHYTSILSYEHGSSMRKDIQLLAQAWLCSYLCILAYISLLLLTTYYYLC